MPDISRTTPVTELPELLLISEAAAWLGIGKTLTYDLVKDGKLPAVKLGRLVRVKREGLVALSNGHGPMTGQRQVTGKNNSEVAS